MGASSEKCAASSRKPRTALLLLALGALSTACYIALATDGGLRLPVLVPARALFAPAAPLSPYVAICLAAKDEWAELPEWVEHHLSIGVGKLYIMDDGSQPPLSTVLGPHIASRAVEYHWFEGVPQPPQPASTVPEEAEQLGAGAAAQVPRDLANGYNYSSSNGGGQLFQLFAYDWCLQHHRHHHTWMAFIDADEYILLRPDIPSFPALLERFEQYGGLALFSKTFGSSGHATRPAVGTRLGFTKCQPPGHREFYKTVANLHYVLPTLGGRVGPHSFNMRDGAATVNSRGVALQPHQSELIVKDEIFLNHYQTRSAQEYAAKARRGGGIHKTGRHNVTHLAWHDSACTLECLDAVRYAQRTQGSRQTAPAAPEAGGQP